MRIEQTIEIPASVDRVWAFVTDLPAVSRCVPDVETLVADGPDAMSGTIRVRVGPIALSLAGTVRLAERDPVSRRAALDIQATDRRIGGGVTARTTFGLSEAAGGALLTVSTDATLLGRLGQFGQPIIRRKADEMAKQWARNVAAALADGAQAPSEP
jgi:carbon monoxide dehydrogenase subunit G